LAEMLSLLTLFGWRLVRISTVTQDSLKFLLIFLSFFQGNSDIFVYFSPSALPLLWFGFFFPLFDTAESINPRCHIPASSVFQFHWDDLAGRQWIPCWRTFTLTRMTRLVEKLPHRQGDESGNFVVFFLRLYHCYVGGFDSINKRRGLSTGYKTWHLN
jgi:hypothetical protein